MQALKVQRMYLKRLTKPAQCDNHGKDEYTNSVGLLTGVFHDFDVHLISMCYMYPCCTSWANKTMMMTMTMMMLG